MLLHRQLDVSVKKNRVVCRRDFIKGVSLAGLSTGMLTWPDLMAVKAEELRSSGMACILLWMQGGPSQFETFDPKPEHANGGETKAIETAVSGIQIADSWPHLAKMMGEVALIRSMTSKEGNHQRATYQLHTGYAPTATVKHPALGAIVAKELPNPQCQLPAFVRIGGFRNSGGGGLLGVEYDPFLIGNPTTPPANTQVPSSTDRYRRRLDLLTKLEKDYGESGAKQEVENHQKLYATTAKMVTSPQMKAFQLSQEKDSTRKAYGSGTFANGCLLARRLVETGVPFVEVSAGNWDTHQDNFDRCRTLSTQVDQPFAALLNDLKERGMLQKTLVVWMGEFGRTPRINPNGGRDHYPRSFNVALAGGGVRGGQVIGSTDKSGSSVSQRPVTVNDLFRSFCHSLQINANKENMSSIGRPIKVVDGGETVQELFS